MKSAKDVVNERYNEYISNYKYTWVRRFVWSNSRGGAKPTTSIIEFFKETGILNDIEHKITLDDFFKQTEELANRYVCWVKTKTSKYSKEEIGDMLKFFIGAIGEFFIVCLLSEMKCIIKFDKTNNIQYRYDFRKVSPNLPNDRDFGVDLTCFANGKPSVIQVKWWNRYSKIEPSLEVFQKLMSEGKVRNYCDDDDDHNRFLFWTGKEDSVTKKLKDCGYSKWCVCFGEYSITDVIDNRAEEDFWNHLYQKLIELI